MTSNFLRFKIKKSTIHLKNLKLQHNNQQRLTFLMNIAEQNVNLQKVLFNSNYNYNSSIFQKGNPFFLIRKNYKRLFWNLLQKSFLSPNLLKFLHVAYWPTHSDKIWRTFYIYHGLELKQRMHYIQPKINKLTYFFSLIFKKTFFHSLLNFKSSLHSNLKNSFFHKLKYFYHLNLNKLKYQQSFTSPLSVKKKKQLFLITNILNKFKYFKTPRFIIKERVKKDFKNFFFLTFRQRIFLKNLITYYFPVISLIIKDFNIHSLPLKTKKPRRV